MSLAQIAFPPPTESGLEEWAAWHWQHHVAIITAMQSVREIALPQRLIYPVNFNDPASVSIFLREHQQLHSDFGAILGIQGNDISNVDFTNQGERESWMWINFTSHQSASIALGLPIL